MTKPLITANRAGLTALAGVMLAACAATPPAADSPPADAVLFSNANFTGESVSVNGSIPDLVPVGFNDRTSSIAIQNGAWEVCEDADYLGRCEVITVSASNLQPARLNDNISSIRPAGSGPYAPVPDAPDYYTGIVLYSDDNLRGEPLAIDENQPDFVRLNYNDRAESVEVHNGVWSVCTDDNYRGRCENIAQTVTDLSVLGLSDNISSVRKVSGDYDPAPGYPGPAPTGQGYPGEETVFYPAPKRAGVRVNNFGDAADEFCREEGHLEAVYFNNGPVLSDLLCR